MTAERIGYIIITETNERGETLKNKIKKLVELVEQLNKLGLKVLELLGTITLIALAIKSLLEMI